MCPPPLKQAWGTKLWRPEFFGRAEGPSHTVTEGRFAYQVIPTAATDSSYNGTVRSPYGYMRVNRGSAG